MIDPPPLPPMNHMEYWWSKYRYTSGLVTESIAPNRQNILKLTLSVFTPHKLWMGTKTIAAPTLALGWVYTCIKMSNEMNDIEKRHHWD